jgi:DNA-directed RNA polymerase II subunit RPB2
MIEKYFDGHHLERLVRHQIESYNNFVQNQIQSTIKMFNPVHIKSEHYKDEKTGKYKLEIVATFNNYQIYRPQIHENNGATKIMFPQEGRLRNFTYASSQTIDIGLQIIKRSGENMENVETLYKNLPRIHIGKLPIMLKSSICVLTQYSHLSSDIVGECYADPGGYFIINGSEKTVLPQERARENRVMCFNIKKNNNKWSWLAEIKSVPINKCISPKQINMTIATKNNGSGHAIYIQIPRIKQPIPLFILFRALGIISDKEICETIILNIDDSNMSQMLYGLKASIIEANQLKTQDECITYITNNVMYTPINMGVEEGKIKQRQFATDVLDNDLFPHCRTKLEKTFFLGYMTNELLQTSFGWKSVGDRDSYANKRIDLAGTLLNNLFRNYFNKLVKDMQKQTVREMNNGSWKSTDDYLNIINQTNIYKIIKSTTIENGIKRALATGDFGIKNTNSNKVGVAQVLSRLTYISSLSHLRRINTPIDKSGKLIPPRKLHNTQWGFICPAESPEGQSVGVVKNLSYLAHITINSDIMPLYDIIQPFNTPLSEYKDNIKGLYDKVKIIINGNWIGIAKEPVKTYEFLKEKKHQGIINIYTSIIFNYKRKFIWICNDAGRLTRPVFRVKNNKLLLTPKHIEDINKNNFKWDDLLVNHNYETSLIEYIDPEEQNTALIAMTPKGINKEKKFYYKYTHCEIHPSTIFGILASCIPFPEHNQSPRNTYQCAMGKQAMGMFASNYKARMDKTAYVQTYTQRPLVDTRIMNIINLNKIPSGCMVVVAIATYSGFNQEDSIIFNKDSIDRGLFSATIYHTEKDEDKKIQGDEEIRCRPDRNKTKGMKFANYNKLNEHGVIPENTLIENRDVIIGKIVPIKENRNDHTKVIKYKDLSRVYRTHEKTYVDKNYIHTNGDGYTFAKIRTRTYRIPKLGDKFSSRHGQKGTIGLILPGEDMPTTADGLRPDIIINPHCLSAMTPITLSNGEVKYIKDIFNEKKMDIKTIDPISLKVSNTKFKDGFVIKSRELKQLTTISGRIIKCTPDHKFLVLNNGKLIWKETRDIIPYCDKMVIHHSILPVPSNDGVNLEITEGEGQYWDRLKSLGFVGQISNDKTMILARLMGIVESDGHISIRNVNTHSIRIKIYVGEEEDINEITNDVITLGFNKPRYIKAKWTYDLTLEPALGYLLYCLGTCVGNKTKSIRKLPEWIKQANSSVKREFLSGYQGGDGSKVVVNMTTPNQQVRIRPIPMRSLIKEDIKNSHRKYLEDMQELFNNFDIKTSICEYKTKYEDRVDFRLAISLAKKNIEKCMDIIAYRYCNHKRRESRCAIEYFKTMTNGIKFEYAQFKECFQKDHLVTTFVKEIKNIDPEDVYDFTTISENHSFIANSFVSHNCIPSRMTIAQLKETLLGKVLLQLGMFGDGTSYGELPIKDICKELLKLGFEKNGNEILYNGMTGQQLETSIFIGPAFYQRLKHMVDDKEHSRAIGPMVVLTRQPAEGRSREGGLRFGEMERDCMVSHGAARFTKDRIYHASDTYQVYTCEKCGMIATFNDEKKIHLCKYCGNTTHFKFNKIPYSCKLLFQELITMNIAPRIIS